MSAMGHRRRRTACRAGSLFALAVVFGLVMLVPFALMVSTAFKPHAYVLETPPRLIPAEPTLDNFVEAWTSNDFGRYFLNSVVVADLHRPRSRDASARCSASCSRATSSPAGAILFGALLFTMMVPGLVLLIPQFVLAQEPRAAQQPAGPGHRLRHHEPGAQHVPAPRVLRGDAPGDVRRSGGRRRRAVADLPVGGDAARRPALATVTIFSFLAAWDEFTWAIVSVVRSSELYTLPVAIRSSSARTATEWGLVFAASLIALAPVLVLFVALQRHSSAGRSRGRQGMTTRPTGRAICGDPPQSAST